ncbi:MAG: hypothetical protein DRR00_28180 [Candidatus Parabeggiatoa sp. nov. 3]|nr:MAG: hypothetical protein DRR00_28180 [Gammaproteobacteria bacterium]
MKPRFSNKIDFAARFSYQIDFAARFSNQIDFAARFSNQIDFAARFSNQIDFAARFSYQIDFVGRLIGMPVILLPDFLREIDFAFICIQTTDNFMSPHYSTISTPKENSFSR